MKLLIIDNYDSFTYNLVHLVREITGSTPDVKRNDCFHPDEIGAYDKLLLSPGPGIPAEAGLLMDVLQRYGHTRSILGICLGHQAIACCFGARLINLQQVFHGVQHPVRQVLADPLFEGVPRNFDAGRYHSWAVDKERLPADLEVIAEDETGLIMGIRHKTHDVRGLQFHPESIMTPHGKQIISNWINN